MIRPKERLMIDLMNDANDYTKNRNSIVDQDVVKTIVYKWLKVYVNGMLYAGINDINLPKSLNGLVLLDSILYDPKNHFFDKQDNKYCMLAMLSLIDSLQLFDQLKMNVNRDEIIKDLTKRIGSELRLMAEKMNGSISIENKSNFWKVKVTESVIATVK